MKKGLLFTLIATVVMASVSFAEDVSIADLLARIEALEKRVAALEAGEYGPEIDATEKTLNEEAAEQVVPTQGDHEPTAGEKNALRSALQYLDYAPFSKSGLAEQLEYEGYSPSEAAYAVENCQADWYEQAVLAAKQYLDYSSFSQSGLVDQLEYEGFSTEEAQYGAEQAYQ